jgi:hypothetical protein
MGDFRIDGMAMRYSQFVPRLYNFCLSLGLRRGRIMPSRAFCSDENQGYPVILLAKHFGTFPFNHGQVGGIVAVDRHGPHAGHGEDLMIIQASHVGYDAEGQRFGVYRRPQTDEHEFGDCCGKLSAVLDWYQNEYQYATRHIQLGRIGDIPVVFIDNHLLDDSRLDGLFLRLDLLIDRTTVEPLRVLSTAKVFPAAAWLRDRLGADVWGADPEKIGKRLAHDMFYFRRRAAESGEGQDQLESNLGAVMPALCTSTHPALDAARYNTQIEFDRTYRSIQRSPAYANRNLVFVAGINIDVSPRDGMLFPLTKFVPWAAYCQLAKGPEFLMEQADLYAALREQTIENPDQISFDDAIGEMAAVDEVKLPTLR